MIQYGGKGAGAIIPVATTTGAVTGVATLPATGSNWVVSAAIALVTALVLWGVVYAVKHRIN